MLSPKMMAQIRNLEIKARRYANDELSGAYRSRFHGRGMDFHEVRAYVDGDEVRNIDWNVTARTGEPHVKVFREERELTVLIAVDVSPSVFSLGASGAKVATTLASVLAMITQRNQDRVGICFFSDVIEGYIAPKKGQAHVWKILKELSQRQVEAEQARQPKTSLAMVLEFLEKAHKKRVVVFLLSDFFSSTPGENHKTTAGDLLFEKTLNRVAHRHELTCVALPSGISHQLPDVGMVRWRDSETGQICTVNTSDSRVREGYLHAQKDFYTRLESACRRANADFFRLHDAVDVVTDFAAFLRSRSSVHRGHL